VEIHHRSGIGFVVNGPLRESLAVGVAEFGEVHPVAGHGVGNVRIGCVAVVVDMLEHERHVRAVRRAGIGLRGVRRIIRVLVEVIQECLVLAVLGLKARPAPGVPAEGAVAGKVAGGLGNAVGLGGIGFEEAFRRICRSAC